MTETKYHDDKRAEKEKAKQEAEAKAKAEQQVAAPEATQDAANDQAPASTGNTTLDKIINEINEHGAICNDTALAFMEENDLSNAENVKTLLGDDAQAILLNLYISIAEHQHLNGPKNKALAKDKYLDFSKQLDILDNYVVNALTPYYTEKKTVVETALGQDSLKEHILGISDLSDSASQEHLKAIAEELFKAMGTESLPIEFVDESDENINGFTETNDDGVPTKIKIDVNSKKFKEGGPAAIINTLAQEIAHTADYRYVLAFEKGEIKDENQQTLAAVLKANRDSYIDPNSAAGEQGYMGQPLEQGAGTIGLAAEDFIKEKYKDNLGAAKGKGGEFDFLSILLSMFSGDQKQIKDTMIQSFMGMASGGDGSGVMAQLIGKLGNGGFEMLGKVADFLSGMLAKVGEFLSNTFGFAASPPSGEETKPEAEVKTDTEPVADDTQQGQPASEEETAPEIVPEEEQDATALNTASRRETLLDNSAGITGAPAIRPDIFDKPGASPVNPASRSV